MSIIATVYLKEGIVMAADSRITGTTTYPDGTKDRYTLSDNAQKLFLIKDGKIGISICGDAELDGKTLADFIRVFELSEVEDTDSVKEVADKLSQYVKGKYSGSVILHVCGYSNEKRMIYRITNGTVKAELDETNESECSAIWNGEPKVLSNLLSGSNAIPIRWNFMQLKDGIDFAEFMIDATSKIHRFQTGIGTCGGPIDILLITKDYSKWIRHKVLTS